MKRHQKRNRIFRYLIENSQLVDANFFAHIDAEISIWDCVSKLAPALKAFMILT